MKKILSKILAPIAMVGVLTPSIPCLSSCSHVDIEKITLSFRPQFICPGKTIQIYADLEPKTAKQGDVKWELIDMPIKGFTITDKGKLIAPDSFVCTEPKTIHVKASYIKNPNVYATAGILIVQSDADNLLGFVDDKVEHLDRSGEHVISTKIIKTEDPTGNYTTIYETEKPIDVFAGRSIDYVKFIPVIKTGYNNRMSFHIFHSDDDKHHCLDWKIGYKDKDWTDTIPEFIPLSAAFKTDEIHVTFYSAPSVIFKIRFNIYQQTLYKTPAVYTYVPNQKEGASRHSIKYNGLGSFSSHLLCPKKQEDKEEKYYMGDLYCYRKPYEYLDFDLIKFNTDEQDKRIAGLFKEIKVSGDDVKTSLPWFTEDYYPAYKLEINYTVDCSKILFKDWEYEPMYVGTLYAYDSLSHDTPACRLDFWIEWDEEV